MNQSICYCLFFNYCFEEPFHIVDCLALLLRTPTLIPYQCNVAWSSLLATVLRADVSLVSIIVDWTSSKE